MENTSQKDFIKLKPLVIAVVVSAAAALLPWVLLAIMNHGLLRVPPEIVDDSVYYYGRMHDVVRGFPFIGNPYFKEHANEIAVAFFGADWISAIPLVLGLGILPAILINVVFWMTAFVLLGYVLGKQLGFRNAHAWLVSAALMLPSFWLIERPVSMQIVFPVFLFFFIAYLWWLKDPRSWKSCALLIFASVASFYLYTYFWQIVAVVLALSHLFLLTKDRRRYYSLLAIDVITGVAILPIVAYTYQQLTHPLYWETMARVGLVQTHTFGGAALTGLAVAVIAGVGGWFASRGESKPVRYFFLITGVALVIANFSNVITGKDMETAVHVDRFIYVWAALVSAYAVLRLSCAGALVDGAAKMPRVRWGICAVLVGVLLTFGGQMVHYLFTIHQGVLSTQAYAEPLDWLNEHAPARSVIFADDLFSYYVPVETNDYVLFTPDGGLHLMPDAEVQTRYLTSRMFAALTLDDVERDVRLYAGVGNAIHQYKTFNRNVVICKLLLRSDCPAPVTEVTYKGVGYFTTLMDQYQQIEKNREATLRKFGVTYIVKDTLNDPSFHPEELTGAHLEAHVGRFDIYSFH